MSVREFLLMIRTKKDHGAGTIPAPVSHDTFEFLFEEVKAFLDIAEVFPAG
jgi:hypothetical protein